MKTGLWSVDAISISCPHCLAEKTSKSGSLMFTQDDDYLHGTPTLTCPACGHKFKAPAWPGARKRKKA